MDNNDPDASPRPFTRRRAAEDAADGVAALALRRTHAAEPRASAPPDAGGYSLKLEYYQNDGGSDLRFSWTAPGPRAAARNRLLPFRPLDAGNAGCTSAASRREITMRTFGVLLSAYKATLSTISRVIVMKVSPRAFALLALAALPSASAALPSASAAAQKLDAKPLLSPLFTDHLVLQRDRQDPVWGWAAPGAKVTVSINGKSATGTAGADGKWMAKLPALAAGGPYDLTVRGPATATLHDILIGDVWICSGQSNMEFGVGNLAAPAPVIAAANYPNLRIFTTAQKTAFTPQDLTTGHWDAVTPETIAAQGAWTFSAVGYFFGRELNQKLNVPIGLIQTCWGGTTAEAWTSEKALDKLPDFKTGLNAVRAQRTAPLAQMKPAPQNQDNERKVATVLYNGMIHPLIPYGVKGAIWYQGESNAGRAYQYRALLPAMIGDWRKQWGEGDFPFYIVQLANFMPVVDQPQESEWAELREAQTMTATNVQNAGEALAIDIGDAANIHPKDKQDVGRRLALTALAKTYGQKIEYSGPEYKSFKLEGSKVRVSFNHLGGGLVASADTPLSDYLTREGAFMPVADPGPTVAVKAFALAGDDHKWYWADAALDGDTVVLSSPSVAHPVAVRYAWANNPATNLYNKAGLPAVPFRTDDWPGLTFGVTVQSW